MILGIIASAFGGQPTPTGLQIGDAWKGGFFAGRQQLGTALYDIIVAPATSTFQPGNVTAIASGTTGYDSDIDGKTNTDVLATAGYEPAVSVRALNINGYTDWYIPALGEQFSAYNTLKPTVDTNTDTARVTRNTLSIPIAPAHESLFPLQTLAPAFKDIGTEDFDSADYLCSSGSGVSIDRFHFGNGNIQVGASSSGLTGVRVRAFRRELSVLTSPIIAFSKASSVFSSTSTTNLSTTIPSYDLPDVSKAVLFASLFTRSPLVVPLGWTLVASQLLSGGGIDQTLYVYKKNSYTATDFNTTVFWGQTVSNRLMLVYSIFHILGSTNEIIDISQIATDNPPLQEFAPIPPVTAIADGSVAFSCASTIFQTVGTHLKTIAPNCWTQVLERLATGAQTLKSGEISGGDIRDESTPQLRNIINILLTPLAPLPRREVNQINALVVAPLSDVIIGPAIDVNQINALSVESLPPGNKLVNQINTLAVSIGGDVDQDVNQINVLTVVLN